MASVPENRLIQYMTNSIINWLSSNEFITLIKDPRIIAVFLTVLLDILRRLIQPKACIVWGIRHGFTFSIPQQNKENLLLYTNSILVKNSGRAPAKEVEFY